MNALTVAFVGNPNCGKSTLFNALTGAKQKVGNWPGVTVDCKTGYFSTQGKKFNVVDLPGIYNLNHSDDSQAIDERIASEYILSQNADVIINVIDGSNLERSLYLTLQLISIHTQVIVAVNMLDVAKRRQIQLDLPALASRLGCKVIGLVANKGSGIQALKKAIQETRDDKTEYYAVNYPTPIKAAIEQLAIQIKQAVPEYNFCAKWLAQQLLLENKFAEHLVTASLRATVHEMNTRLQSQLEEDVDILLADTLYSESNFIATQVSKQIGHRKTITQRIDKIVLNRFLGIPIFLSMMYIMFLFAINLGGAFQDFFDLSSDAIFVQGTSEILQYLHAPPWLIAVLAAGFGRGINTTVTFIPVIAAMFFFLAFLESTGYMARASFVIDRFMRMVGLPGKSFVPMIVGFGCNVPAILAARTLENPRDRTLTILMSPFMSCGARLAIFAVFTAAFFPTGGQNIVFLLYLIGIIAAILTGFILQKTLLKGDLSPLVLELPAYHLPTLKMLCLHAWQRLKSFIFRAGKLIVPVCMLIGILNAVNIDGTLNTKNSSADSILSSIGRFTTPVLAPLGISNNNWPATVSLVTGVLAKEVVIATLNTLYTQDANLSQENVLQPSITDGLKAAVVSVPVNLIDLKDSFTNPIKTDTGITNHHVYGVMYERFNGPIAAFSYLLFVLLYFPCISATAVMAKELNKKWTAFSVAWSTGLAYAVATCFYQVATFSAHPKQSCFWLFISMLILASGLSLMKFFGAQHNKGKVNYVTKTKAAC